MLAKFLAPALLVLASSAQAAEVVAKYAVDAGGDFDHPALATLSLDADGVLTIEKSTYDLSQGQLSPLTTGRQTVTEQLDQLTYDTVLRQLVTLSEAEIQTTKSQVVCMMMPRFGAAQHVLQVRRGYDWQTKSFSGELVTVDNNAGCWQSLHVQPKADDDRTTAKVVEGELQVLALTALSHG